MKTHLSLKRFALALALAGSSGVMAATVDLLSDPMASQYYTTYGNANVYSLPLQAQWYALQNGGGTGPGNPFYIASSPGAIKDEVVIYTGSNGQKITTNPSGFDNAYGSPEGSNKKSDYADTAGNNATPPDTTGKAIANNYATTWDADVGALKSMVGDSLVFLFNNNQTDSNNAADQSLGIWAKLWVTDANGVVQDLTGNGLFYLYLSNMGAAYGEGGALTGDASAYNGGDVAAPLAGTASTDYVMAGGKMCTDANLNPQACDGTQAYEFDHNLGQNQVAYAAIFPVLDAYLASLDDNVVGYTLHLQLNMGCDPSITAAGGSCLAQGLNGGDEQLFMVTGVEGKTPPHETPEPETLALAGLALLGMVVARRRMGKH